MKLKIFSITIAVAVTATLTVYFFFPGLLISAVKGIDRGLAGLSQDTTQVEDHTIAYLDGGSGEIILMLHGYGGDKDNWTKFSKDLTNMYRTVIPDLPGFGESTKSNTASYDIASQSERIHKFTKKLGIKKCHIIGHSMGGNIAAHYAYKYPEQILSLALFDAAGVVSPVKSHFIKNLEKGRNLLVAKDAEDFERLMNYLFVNPPHLPGPISRYLAQQAALSRSFNEHIMKDLIDKLVIVTPYLPSIQAPAFILWGDTDRIIDISSVTVFEKHLPKHTTVIMKDCGHVPMVERPEESAGHYRKFLASQ